MDTTTSQRTAILTYLRAGHSLTPLRALSLFHCMALSQRIGDIERRNLKPSERIVRSWVLLSGGKRVRQYSLKLDPLEAALARTVESRVAA